MNIKDLTEEANGMGTSSIAVAPVGVGGMQKRNPDGTAKNALDQDNLLGGTKKKKKKKLSENDISKLKSLEKELKSTEKKIQAGDVNYTDKATIDLFKKTAHTISAINFEQMALDMFKKFVEQVDLGIKQGKYSAEDLPKMQLARDKMAAQIPALEKHAAKAKDRVQKYQPSPEHEGINTIAEGKKPWFKDGVPMCSKECCGTPVMECTCGDDCKHCNCSELKKMMKENNMSDTKKKGSSIKEGLADLAQVAERDHEVQMARADLYKIAKYSIKLHEMLKTVSEQEGLEGWVQSKITKAADYMGSVYHHLDYDMKFAEEVVSEKAVKEGDGIYHNCAKSFKHQTYGECTVIPGEHTLFEDGTVTHYDATFTSCGQQYIVRNVPVSRMTDIISENHSHMPVKKKKKK
jgi:hypothetical protein